jgi:hypothetical protein
MINKYDLGGKQAIYLEINDVCLQKSVSFFGFMEFWGF